MRREVLVACCSALFVTGVSNGATEQSPSVTIKFFFVKETRACRPGGYPLYDEASEQRSCAKWTADEVQHWTSGQHLVHQAPPGDVSLDELYDSIDAYQEKCSLGAPCGDPARRRAVVLLFVWDNLGDTSVSLRRFGDGEHIAGGYWSGTVEAGGRWVNHQRADYFFPGYGVHWVLKAGGHEWNLAMAEPD
jgi:hypothetical protein